MRFMVKCTLSTEAVNAAILDGTLSEKLKAYMESVKPDAAYFTLSDGRRTAYFIIDVPGEHKLPERLEPMWLDFKADVFIEPVMTVADFEKARPDIERVAAARR